MAYKLIDRPTQETRLAATSMVQLLVAFAVAAGVLLLYVSCRDAPTAAPTRKVRAPASLRALPRPAGDRHTYTLVLGAVCNERRHDFRERLRGLYAPHVASRTLLLRFVVSEKKREDVRWREREMRSAATLRTCTSVTSSLR